MWIFIWVILSAFVLGVFGWSQVILQQQKRCWAIFAKRHNLSYTSGKFTESPTLTGTMDGFRINLSTAAQQTADARGQRFFTLIEVNLGPGLTTSAAIATPTFEILLGELKMKESLPIAADQDWSAAYLNRARNAKDLEAYLTVERRKALHDIFSMKTVRAIFFFDEIDAVLHLETTDPLRNPDAMEKIVKRILKNLKVLAPQIPAQAASV